MPKVRRSPSIFRDSWVASHAFRRASRGCAESGKEADDVAVEGPTPMRRVSWRPGADGAPADFGARWEWDVEWPEGGAMRIA